MAAARKKPAGPAAIRHATGAPEPAQAAQIALLIMKAAKVNTWSALVELASTRDVREIVNLTAVQQDIIDRHRDLLPYLSVKPIVTVIACPVCGRFGFWDTRSSSKICPFTIRCSGTIVKASSVAARATESEREDPATQNATAGSAPVALFAVDDGLFG